MAGSVSAYTAVNTPVSYKVDPGAAMTAFAQNCFSPLLTAARAEQIFAITGVSYDFYDLDPLSPVSPSPAKGRAVTIGTDRRCEISFDGAFGAQAANVVVAALGTEGLQTPAKVPAVIKPTAGTSLLTARRLYPVRVAVVQVGTRAGRAGTETFMVIERLLSESEKS